MVTPGASSSQDSFAHAATPEPEAAPSRDASAVPTWRAEPRWASLAHLLDHIPAEKTLASAHGHSFASASSKKRKRVSFADDPAGAHKHGSSSSTSSWASPSPPQRPPTFGSVTGGAAFRAAANAISSASEEEAGDAREDDDHVAQYIGLERATFCGPYHWVTDPEEACYYMKELWFDVMGSRDKPILGIDVKCYYGEVCMVQLASWRRALVLDALELQHYVGGLLQPLLTNQQICKVFHGDFNVSWLHSTFNVGVSPPIFDTYANAQQLDIMWEDSWQLSLQMMCRRYLSYELDDTFQTANWYQRPMPKEMLDYAAIEVQLLLPLESAIEREMNRARGYAWEKQIL